MRVASESLSCQALVDRASLIVSATEVTQRRCWGPCGRIGACETVRQDEASLIALHGRRHQERSHHQATADGKHLGAARHGPLGAGPGGARSQEQDTGEGHPLRHQNAHPGELASGRAEHHPLAPRRGPGLPVEPAQMSHKAHLCAL